MRVDVIQGSRWQHAHSGSSPLCWIRSAAGNNDAHASHGSVSDQAGLVRPPATSTVTGGRRKARQQPLRIGTATTPRQQLRRTTEDSLQRHVQVTPWQQTYGIAFHATQTHLSLRAMRAERRSSSRTESEEDDDTLLSCLEPTIQAPWLSIKTRGRRGGSKNWFANLSRTEPLPHA